ncbi:MAG: 50S ribosomal protein L29 [Thermoguttaceae bacterium]
MKPAELRDMSTEQLNLMLKEARETFFRLRLQSRMEKLDAPSELLKNKKLIARIHTVLSQREKAVN